MDIKKFIRYSVSGLIPLCLIAAITDPAGAARLWFSDTPTPAAVTNPTLTIPVGGSGSLYLYAEVTAGEVITGLGLDIDATTPGIASGTIGSWANPNFSGQDRWNTSSGGQDHVFTAGELVSGLNAVAVSGVWGLNGNVAAALDPLYDATTLSVLVGRIDVTGDSVGSTDVFLAIGPATIAGVANIEFGAADAAMVPTGAVGTASNVADARIVVTPEPATFAVLAVAFAGFIQRSRS